MRRIARSLHLLVTEAIGLDGFLVAVGFTGLAAVAATTDWRLGLAIFFGGLLAAGIAVARPAR